MSPDSQNKIQQYHHVRQTAVKLLDDFGLSEQGWHFHYNTNKRRLGYCDFDNKRISLSQHYIFKGDSWMNTLLHEIAHALVGPGHNHDEVWRQKCREIGARPVALAHPSTFVNTARPNYKIECPSCGWSVTRFRMKRRNHGSRCPKCGTIVKIYRLVYKRGGGNA